MAGKLGKKIDTWEVNTEAGILKILVYMTPSTRGGDSVTFTAVCDEAVPRYHRNMKDVNELKTDAVKTVKQNAQLVWTRKLLVHTGARRKLQHEDGISNREESALSIQWQVIEVGLRPDGQYLHRYLEHHGPWGTRIQQGLPDLHEFETEDHKAKPWLDEPKEAWAMLDYTPENVAALQSLCTGLGELALRVANIMGPSRVAKMLLGIEITNPLRIGVRNVEDKTVVTEATSRPGSSAASGGTTKKGRGTRTVASGAAAEDA